MFILNGCLMRAGSGTIRQIEGHYIPHGLVCMLGDL
jgi:hypothetical protein